MPLTLTRQDIRNLIERCEAHAEILDGFPAVQADLRIITRAWSVAISTGFPVTVIELPDELADDHPTKSHPETD
jgi:hypothetical protein